MAQLISGLIKLKEDEDRATLAALRRGLGKAPGSAGGMYPFVVPRLLKIERDYDPDGGWPWEHKCCFIVASLFAWHPENLESGERWERNFGASARRLKHALGENAVGPERRFVALLNAESEDLPDHLRALIGLFRANAIPVDWEQLLTDLTRWNRTSRPVQIRWARSFWRASHDGDSEPEGESGE